MDKRYNNVTSVKKESPEKHVKQGNPHLHAVDLEKKNNKKNLWQILTIKSWFLLRQ